MSNDNMMHDHDHDHEMYELNDEELAQVSGGVGKTTTCPCKRHQPPPDDTM